ncbi:MAG: hypothetical protein ACKO3R_06710 [bacterium]
MPGPDNINNLSRQIGGAAETKAASNVSGDGGESTVGGVNPKVSEGATVAGSGIDANTAGKAKLAMMAGNNIVSTNGFFKGKIQEKPYDGSSSIQHPINAQMAALLPKHPTPEITTAFTDLEARAKGSPTLASPQEILLGKGAIIPNAGIIDSNSLIEALKLEAKANGIPIGINTEQATRRLIELFNSSTRD